jgi:energy-coupling factor transporter ATP-binding protein EcfA2
LGVVFLSRRRARWLRNGRIVAAPPRIDGRRCRVLVPGGLVGCGVTVRTATEQGSSARHSLSSSPARGHGTPSRRGSGPLVAFAKFSMLYAGNVRSTVDVAETHPHGISSISVRDLFGLFNYELRVPPASTPDLARILVLYGDNGSGKTTILRLLFHLLSPAPRRGHRTFLARTPFSTFEVSFSSGLSVTATRRGPNRVGAYELQLSRAGEQLASVRVSVDQEGSVPPAESPELDAFTARVFKEHKLDLYYLGDDRRLETDLVQREDQRYYDEDDEFLEIYDPVRGPRVLRREQGPVADLKLAIDRATSAIRQQVFGASNLGGESTNAIYTEVIRRIANPYLATPSGTPSTKDELLHRLTSLASRSELFQKFGLVPALRDQPILDSIRSTPDDRWDILQGVLTPFLDGFEARLDALNEIAESLGTFVESLNSFYHDKRVSFTLQRGIRIAASNGDELEPDALSSGERHLLLVLTNLLYARERSGLFIFDEPEISLNMKWQRKLIDALLDCTRGSGTLFVLASHSFELISAADERVVHLSYPLTQRLPLN